MCLDYQKLKVYDDNDSIRIGYKIFFKTQIGYENRFFTPKAKYYQMGEWVDNKQIKQKTDTIECRSCYPKFKPKYYKAGFHFYSTIPYLLTASWTPNDLRVVECICENITATGRQDNKSCFVAQSYRLMREVQ